MPFADAWDLAVKEWPECSVRLNMSSKRAKPAGPWGQRVDDLIRACGWTQVEAGRHFGIDPRMVERVRLGRGKNPKVKFLRQLATLEKAYSEERAGYHQGAIHYFGRERVSFLSRSGSRSSRPADLAALEQPMGGSAAGPGVSRPLGGDQIPPPRDSSVYDARRSAMGSDMRQRLGSSVAVGR